MKGPYKLIVLLLLLSSLLLSCADVGAGETGEEYADYFSSVVLMYPGGKTTMSMHDFYEAIDLGESDDELKVVTDYEDYRLIAFEIANGYTLKVEEFAFFLRSKEKPADLAFEFYISDKLPKKVGGNEELPQPGETPGEGENPSETPSDPELTEEDVFGGLESYYDDVFSIHSEWDSVHLSFDEEQTAKAGQYIVIRIIQNKCTCGEEDSEPSVPFTFNYLLFYVSDAIKD